MLYHLISFSKEKKTGFKGLNKEKYRSTWHKIHTPNRHYCNKMLSTNPKQRLNTKLNTPRAGASMVVHAYNKILGRWKRGESRVQDQLQILSYMRPSLKKNERIATTKPILWSNPAFTLWSSVRAGKTVQETNAFAEAWWPKSDSWDPHGRENRLSSDYACSSIHRHTDKWNVVIKRQWNKGQ